MNGRSVVRAASKYYWHQCEELFRSIGSYIPSSFNETSEGVEPFEKGYQEKEDPWDYATSPYELTKYRQTLDLLPPIPFDNALECACSEGVFTSQLAERVKHLLGADISPTALRRAKNRCREQKNVRFVQLDLTRDALPGRFDLIVCSEVLYFIGGRRGLERVACKLASSLVDRGYLLMAHLNLLKESPKEAGFAWNLAYGAKTIGEVFQETYPLRLIREMQFPLYRLHLFQRQPVRAYVFGSVSPEITEIPTQPTELSPELAAHVRWNVAST
jgi:2-polyprenyl-3-methyl-5-hydroxy-6-metoxy-1,4-benzoquinol methylase